MKALKIIFSLLMLMVLVTSLQRKSGDLTTYKTEVSQVTDSTIFVIFENKCNGCHQNKKQTIFTPDNVQAYYLAIESQVLIKKRMPKRNAPQLTDAEREAIAEWVVAVKADR